VPARQHETQAVESGPGAQRPVLRDRAAALFLDQYYPFHYEVGFTIERHLRDPRLTQHQTVMLWIIHATAGERGRMPRKDIERQLKLWFDVTSSAISKALRGLAGQPLGLLLIEENPESAREKYVSLTARGRQMVQEMNARGEAIVQRIIDQLSTSEIEQGLHFLRQVSAIVRNFPAENETTSKTGEGDEPD
jgi:DNA-binding MarR family transcriptional regulator